MPSSLKKKRVDQECYVEITPDNPDWAKIRQVWFIKVFHNLIKNSACAFVVRLINAQVYPHVMTYEHVCIYISQVFSYFDFVNINLVIVTYNLSCILDSIGLLE